MKKLFALKDSRANDSLLVDVYFENKEQAKAERKKRNPKNDDGKEVFHFMVTRGPEHWKGLNRHSSWREAAKKSSRRKK